MQVGELFASLSLQYSEFSTGLKAATAEAYRAGQEMQRALGGDLTRGLDQSTRSVKNAGGAFSQLGKDVTRVASGIVVAQAFYKVAGAIQDATASLFAFNNSLEEANIAFKYLIGSAGAGREFVKMLQDFAATTPFSFESAQKGSRQLLSMGFAAKEVIPTLKTLSDATSAAGGKPEIFDRIVYALGQIKSTGKLLTRDLMQLAQAGIPVFKILQEELQLTSDQMENLTKAGISADTGIAAILRGLEKRYKGASDEISKTTRGLLSNISDDFQIIGGALVRGLSENFKGALTTIAEKMDAAREIVQEFGAGGLIDRIFPPGMQTQIRAFVAYIGELVRAMGQLMAAVQPLSREMFYAFVNVFNAAAPVIIMVLRTLTGLISAVTQSTGAVRFLAFALTMLFVSAKVATAVGILASAVKKLGIAGIVSQMVTALGKAVGFLSAMLVTNPIVAVVAVIAAALLALAMSTQTAKRWMDSLTKSIAQFMGMNIDSVWEPVDPSEAAKDMADFADQMDKTAGGVTDAGNAADKTGDKIKGSGDKADKAKKKNEKWLASFDEVFPVKEEVEDLADAVGGAGDAAGDAAGGMGDLFDNVPKLPDFKPPNLPDVTPLIPIAPIIPPPVLPPMGPIDDWGTQLRKTLDGLRKYVMEPWPPIPPIPVPNVQPALDGIKTKLEGWKQDVIDSLDSVLEAGRSISVPIGDTFNSIADVVQEKLQLSGEAALNFGNSISLGLQSAGEKVLEFGNSISANLPIATDALAAFASSTGESLANAFGSIDIFSVGSIAAITAFVATSLKMKDWGAESGGAVSSFASAGILSIAGFASQTQKTIDDWTSATMKDVSVWSTGNSTAIGTFSSNSISSIGTFVSTTGAAISGWVGSTSTEISNWATGTATTVSNWTTDTAANISTWASNTASNISTWATSTAGNISSWASDAGSAVNDWVTNTSGNIASWGSNTGGNIATWANSGISNISSFVESTSGGIAAWAVGTAGAVEAWTDNAGGNIGKFAESAQASINAFCTGAWGSFSNFLSSSAEAVASWANSIISNIGTMAQSAFNSLASLAAAAGASIGSGFSDFGGNVSSAFAGMGSFVSKHKNVIVPAALTIGALAGIGAIVATGGTAAGPIMAGVGALAGFETGGIIDQDSIVRVGEKGRREAIVPLDNAAYMAPFADAVAARLGANMGSSSTPSDLRPLYVGTLIADERGLQELNRQMKIIDEEEMRRRGL